MRRYHFSRESLQPRNREIIRLHKTMTLLLTRSIGKYGITTLTQRILLPAVNEIYLWDDAEVSSKTPGIYKISHITHHKRVHAQINVRLKMSEIVLSGCIFVKNALKWLPILHRKYGKIEKITKFVEAFVENLTFVY